MNTIAGVEYNCDVCNEHVPNGSGYYPPLGDDRTCRECYERRLACDHPISKWQHNYDHNNTLGDYYTCSLCGELTQVG